jgi:signal transduction histidine kinase
MAHGVTADGSPCLEGLIEDVTAQRQAEERLGELNATLEERVENRTAELEAANRELEAFSYSVSHDLRTPVRAIEGFAAILCADAVERLNAEDQRLLGVVRKSARQMGHLVDDLLAFSRMSRSELKHGTVDMGSLAAGAREELLGGEAREKTDFEIGELPHALGDAALLKQVWLNLIGNALKFSAGCERPCVEIGGRVEGAHVEYWVTDNGVGFDPLYVHRLFKVFQRLHSSREFEGTGIGLALVYRIVLRHGGQVSAEGAVGQGATFRFTLPAAARE